MKIMKIMDVLHEMGYSVSSYDDEYFLIDVSDIAEKFGILFKSCYYIFVEVKERDDTFKVSVCISVPDEYDLKEDIAIELARMRGIKFSDVLDIYWEHQDIVEEAEKICDKIAYQIIMDIAKGMKCSIASSRWNSTYNVWEFDLKEVGNESGNKME